MNGFDEQEYNKPFDLMVWKKVIPFIGPYRKTFYTVLLLSILGTAIDIAMPLFNRYAITNFIRMGSTVGMGPFAALYTGVILLQTVGVIFFARQAMVIELNLGKDLKRAAFVKLQTLSLDYYNTTPVGYILARVMSDTDRISGMVSWGLIDMLWSFFYVIGVFVSMLLLNPKLALLVIAVVPILALLTGFFQGKLLRLNRLVRRANSKIVGSYNEGIMGAKTSKTLVIEDRNHGEFRELTEGMRSIAVRTAMLNGIYIPLILLFSSMSVAVVLSKGGSMAIDSIIDIGTLSVFITYAVGIFEPIQQLARHIAELVGTQANLERVFDLIEKEPTITDTLEVTKRYGDAFHPKQINWEPIKGDIEFKDVSFKYPDGGEYILENFNLSIKAGTNMAIVGETGAGKSTLVNLACRFFEPTKGQILIDGVDYRLRSQQWLHSNIGYVLQSPHLFSGTVADNIRYGKLDATMEEIIAAAKSVSADQAITRLEKGYDSDVGESGDKLSTGEKQLISFARAVIADPPIFVLDEATSSIDTQTELLIQNAIAKLLKNRTSFLIAHRLSTIRQADLILVVSQGRVIEQGTHKELMRQKGHYFSLYSKQFEEEAMASFLKQRKKASDRS